MASNLRSSPFQDLSNVFALFNYLLSWDGKFLPFLVLFSLTDILLEVPVFVLLVCTFHHQDMCSDYSTSSSTTYMGQVMAYELDREPDADYATRVGEFAMLLYSIGMYIVFCEDLYLIPLSRRVHWIPFASPCEPRPTLIGTQGRCG